MLVFNLVVNFLSVTFYLRLIVLGHEEIFDAISGYQIKIGHFVESHVQNEHIWGNLNVEQWKERDDLHRMN